METEYNNVNNIGRTYQFYNTPTEKLLHQYYHKQEVKIVSDLLKKMKPNYETVIDLGSAHGFWYTNYKKMGFKKIVGIDISEERVIQAKQCGYDEVYTCNAYDLPFENKSQDCIVSNNVFVHVLQDFDKEKIFHEVKRVLRKNGIFIVGIANAMGYGFKTDTTVGVSGWSTKETIMRFIDKSDLKLEIISPSFYTIPRIGAHPYFAAISTKIIFPLIDALLKGMKNVSPAKVVYYGIRKL